MGSARTQREIAEPRQRNRRPLRDHRRGGAKLAIVLYVAAIIGFPGLHLWHHTDDHDHHAGGIHYRLGPSSAEHHHDILDDDHEDGEDHDHDAADHTTAESSAEDSAAASSLASLRPLVTPHSPADFTGHAEDSLAHFACSYLIPKSGLVKPLCLPACSPATSTFHQSTIAHGILRGASGARAPPMVLSA